MEIIKITKMKQTDVRNLNNLININVVNVFLHLYLKIQLINQLKMNKHSDIGEFFFSINNNVFEKICIVVLNIFSFININFFLSINFQYRYYNKQ